MYDRYYEIKNIYNDFLVFMKVKDKYKLIGIDKKLYDYLNVKKFKYFKWKHINYLLLDELEIEEIKKFDDNKYYEVYIKVKIKGVLEKGLGL